MRPGVLLLSGPPCSGKSSIARILAARPPLPDQVHVEVVEVVEVEVSPAAGR